MKHLPPETVRLLSSSQVVTSVLSVVKELVENALDAGASSIEVKLDNYGFDRVEVRDNGSGIEAADAPVMAVKHYTSKISSPADFDTLETYGFRGEALGSICAVAEVVVTSKTADADLSTQYTLDSEGHVLSQKPSHLGQGTTVTVCSLFKNLPVRKQFYSTSKKCKEELKRIQDLLMAYAIIQPELRLTFTHNKALVWHKAKVSDSRAGLMCVLGTAAMNNMMPVQFQQDEPQVDLSGFIPRPGSDNSMSSSSTDRTFVFINARPVHHKEILKLIRRYHGGQPSRETSCGRYPLMLLDIRVPAQSVDVNVTPDKTQVLLHNKDVVLVAVETALASVYGPLAEVPCSLLVPPEVEQSHSAPDLASEEGTALPQPPLETTAEPAGVSEEVQAGGTKKQQGRIDGDRWSLGHLPSDPASEEHLQPVKVFVPKRDGAPVPSCGPDKTPSKVAKVTAYDLISNRAVRQPQSASALFSQEARVKVLADNPEAGPQEISNIVERLWKNAPQEERKKYEEKAERETTRYECQSKRASEKSTEQLAKLSRAPKHKAVPSKQQILDKLLLSQAEKPRPPLAPDRPCRDAPFSLAALKTRLNLLSKRVGPSAERMHLIGQLGSHPAWLVSSGDRLLLLNPFRAEERLLFRRLLAENLLPTEKLESPLRLSDGLLGGSVYREALCSMEKTSVGPGGTATFSDARLVANGFQIRHIPGATATDGLLEIVAMATCVPFYGLSDLKDILHRVVHDGAQSVQQCRPLKVHRYLEGEAVRLARRLPLMMTKEDVDDTLSRMSGLEGDCTSCLHGRPLLHHLLDLPAQN
ncbi:PMS1 protein, partial [Polypterus senegalus]|nr:PMS1 protein [Polypterus senegalus]